MRRIYFKPRRADLVICKAAFDANYCWLWRIIVQAEALELLELAWPQCDNSIRVYSEACHIDKVKEGSKRIRYPL
ncbi:Uncharacterized protein HZ326_27956 [Fusarium oxysporum f. sp. albedinis]|nr:Uncharacterized protein HZ326_27956 [Fusarium oxysporum f. sp. albedinis]